jgi:hypothetical protein
MPDSDTPGLTLESTEPYAPMSDRRSSLVNSDRPAGAGHPPGGPAAGSGISGRTARRCGTVRPRTGPGLWPSRPPGLTCGSVPIQQVISRRREQMPPGADNTCITLSGACSGTGSNMTGPWSSGPGFRDPQRGRSGPRRARAGCPAGSRVFGVCGMATAAVTHQRRQLAGCATLPDLSL